VENMVEPDTPQITIKYGAEKMQFSCWMAKARIETHILNI
jgi:hypothetical protein